MSALQNTRCVLSLFPFVLRFIRGKTLHLSLKSCASSVPEIMLQHAQVNQEEFNCFEFCHPNSISKARPWRSLLFACRRSYLAGAGVVVLLLSACHREIPVPEAPSVAVTVARPLEREVLNYAEFTGNTAAVSSVDIRARVGGYLARVGFTEGTSVKAGDVLFVIDQRPYQAALDLAQANLEQAEAQKDLAQSNFERSEQLRERGVIDPQSYETQVANLNQTKATVLAKQAELETAKLNIEFTQVISPIDGRTSTINFTVGNLITAGDLSHSGVLTTVVSIDPIYVYSNVDSQTVLAYSQLVQEGKMPSAEMGKVPIEMQVAGESNYPHKGFIDFLDNQVDPSTGTIRIRGTFANTDKLLRPGLFAQVRIPFSPRRRALLISDLALAYDQGQPVVYIVGTDNTAKAIPVRLGPLSEGLRVVESGVSTGDRVVVDGVIHLRPGSKITLQEANMANFSGEVRKQVSIAPVLSSNEDPGPNQSTQNKRSEKPVTGQSD
ncbi:MAG: efflux RND transporter periplasmic adaptor subunit [Verrucomicrobia bacterium]|nr:efflux RND transporter periplasmic adaptor subunit [Verrucomicrobiota bacterium]